MSTTPSTLVIDVSTMKEEQRVKNQNFKIPTNIELLGFMSPIADIKETKYELFGIIVKDPTQIGKKTLCLTKKRMKTIKKN